MKMKFLIRNLLLVLVLLTTVIATCACDNNKNEIDTNTDANITTETTSQESNEKRAEAYEAKVYHDGDHYVLNILTHNIDNDITISYDSKNFLLDDTSTFFADNAIAENNGDEQGFNKLKIKLESNKLYEFNFIELGSEKLSIGKNIIIE